MCDLCRGTSNEYLSGYYCSTKTAFFMTGAELPFLLGVKRKTLPTASADFLSDSHGLW